jgi:hypothetical protein
MTHTDRISAIVSSFEEAMARFQSRLAGASSQDAERPRADGGWSAAQVAWHVAAVNEAFAGLIDGSRPMAQPAPADFVERTWAEIGASLEKKLQAPARMQPETSVTQADAIAKLEASRGTLLAAVRGLQPDRGVMMIDSPLVGRVTLYQIGEWATLHVIRHNKQMKGVLAG